MKTRLIQWLVRLIGYGLSALTSWLGMHVVTNGVAVPIATGLATLVCLIADYYLHKKQLPSWAEAWLAGQLGTAAK